MSGGGAAGGRELDNTPTWAVSLVVLIIILISILLEKTIHKVGQSFVKRKKFALVEALEKIKAELMILGFISLLLTFGQNFITRICIPEHVANTMLPCDFKGVHEATSHEPPHSPRPGDHAPEGPPHSAQPGGSGDHAPPQSAEPEGSGDHTPEGPPQSAEHGGPGDHAPEGPPQSAESGGSGDHAPEGAEPGGSGDHAPEGTEPGGSGDHAPEGPPQSAEPGGSGDHAPETPHSPESGGSGEHLRRLLYDRRFLAADTPSAGCREGHVPLISANGLHQLHIFIFFLAVFHVFYSAITMMLGRLKIRGWKEWEQHIAQETEATNDPSRFRLTHEDSFIKSHSRPWMQNPILFYIGCFFRHMVYSVQRPDYATLRHGFVSVHLSPGTKFDFQKYIKRSLEDDFKVVVGIPPHLWLTTVIYLLLNVRGGEAMFVLSVMPLVITLAVGTKLQSIITQMAIEIHEKHAVLQGIPLVSVSDRHFWFSKPGLVLTLIHLVLFQNAFEITYFLWITYEFGIHSCFHSYFTLAVIRVCIGVGVQFLCSYITLPLYALVTQMGSHMKKSIFDEQTNKALMSWHNKVKKKDGAIPTPPKIKKLGGNVDPLPVGGAGNTGETSIEMSEKSPKEMTDIDLLTGS